MIGIVGVDARRARRGIGPDADEGEWSRHFPFAPESHIRISWCASVGRSMSKAEDDDLEVVWTGDMPLLAPRDQRPHFTYVEPRRKYNKKPTQAGGNPTQHTSPTTDEEGDLDDTF